MLIETVELDLANVGLGALHEVALLRLFATVQARRIVAGTGLTLPEIADADGRLLYPGFFRTALEVPRPLDEIGVWQKVAFGVDVRRYGRLVLDAHMVLDRAGELGDDPSTWDSVPRIRMRGASMFVVDDRAGPMIASPPKEGAIAELATVTRPPAAMTEVRDVRASGRIDGAPHGPLRCTDYLYPVLDGRDAPTGRAMMFSTFTTIVDAAEQHLLYDHAWPPVPRDLAPFVKIAERTFYYLDNVRAGDRIRVELRGGFAPCPDESSFATPRVVCPAVLDTHAQLYAAGSGSLVGVARTRKIVAIPRELGTLAQDAARIALQHRGVGDG